jgi:hypothetical protein
MTENPVTKTCPNCDSQCENDANRCKCGWDFHTELMSPEYYLEQAGDRRVPWYLRGWSVAWKAAIVGGIFGWLVAQPENAETTRGLYGMPSDEEVLKGIVAGNFAFLFVVAGFLWGVVRK